MSNDLPEADFRPVEGFNIQAKIVFLKTVAQFYEASGKAAWRRHFDE